jgi:lysophospholipase L1-like esterase
LSLLGDLLSWLDTDESQHSRVAPIMTDANSASINPTTRRSFLAAGAGLTAAGVAAISSLDALAEEQISRKPKSANLPRSDSGKIILFQGDSITDAGRKKDDLAPNSPAALGKGYAWLAAAEMLVASPGSSLEFYNRGISGNKVYQLAERWQTDCLDLKPDMLSILIGVNDFWHKHKHGYEGTLEKYETDYRALLQRTKVALPKVEFMICEPFVLNVGAVDDSWFPEFDGYRAAAKRVAESFDAIFVPFQSMFDEAVKIAPPERWAADGVHPTDDGATLMAYWWLKALGACL